MWKAIVKTCGRLVAVLERGVASLPQRGQLGDRAKPAELPRQVGLHLRDPWMFRVQLVLIPACDDDLVDLRPSRRVRKRNALRGLAATCPDTPINFEKAYDTACGSGALRRTYAQAFALEAVEEVPRGGVQVLQGLVQHHGGDFPAAQIAQLGVSFFLCRFKVSGIHGAGRRARGRAMARRPLRRWVRS